LIEILAFDNLKKANGFSFFFFQFEYIFLAILNPVKKKKKKKKKKKIIKNKKKKKKKKKKTIDETQKTIDFGGKPRVSSSLIFPFF
jgi:hypothetical protein